MTENLHELIHMSEAEAETAQRYSYQAMRALPEVFDSENLPLIHEVTRRLMAIYYPQWDTLNETEKGRWCANSATSDELGEMSLLSTFSQACDEHSALARRVESSIDTGVAAGLSALLTLHTPRLHRYPKLGAGEIVCRTCRHGDGSLMGWPCTSHEVVTKAMAGEPSH